jgi:hypothetical protein
MGKLVFEIIYEIVMSLLGIKTWRARKAAKQRAGEIEKENSM